MQKIYSRDECAPDAKSADKWLAERLKVKNLYFDVIFKSPASFKMESGDGDTQIFKYQGVYYVIECSCGVYQDVYTATDVEVKLYIERYLSRLLES